MYKAGVRSKQIHTIFISMITVVVVAIYAVLFRNYRVNTNIDISWSLSFSYNYCIKGIDTDATFGVPFPVGQGGTIAFGKLAAMVQCAALVPFNWSLIAATLLSVAGVLLSMTLIFVFVVDQGLSRLDAAACCLALAATEPFVAMANQPRSEYLTFLLAVCGLVLAARCQLFPAGLISALAIELQPIGIMAPVYLIAYELSRMIQTRRFHFEFDRAAKLVLGGILGLAVYFILHPNILVILANGAGWNNGGRHFLYEYFFEARLCRHLPELAVFAVCLMAHIGRRDYVKWPFPLVASLATFAVGLLLPHANAYYTPFWYFPSFVLVYLTANSASRAVVVPLLVFALFVPQYAIAYVWAHKYARQDELQVARSLIAGRGTDLSHAHVYGDFIFWPVFKDLAFHWAPTAMSKQLRESDTTYLICGVDPPFIKEEHVCGDELPAFRNMRLVGQFSWAARKYLIYERAE